MQSCVCLAVCFVEIIFLSVCIRLLTVLIMVSAACLIGTIFFCVALLLCSTTFWQILHIICILVGAAGFCYNRTPSVHLIIVSL